MLPPSAKSWSKFFPYLILVAAVFAAYANIYGNQFVFDDQALIVENEYLRYWHSLGLLFVTPIMAGSYTCSDFYRPLQTLLYFFIFQIGGLSVFSFHFLNISLHAANAGLLYRLGCKIKFNSAAAFCAALLWALHPLQTEAVTYISGTADLLYTFFCLLGLVILVPDFNPRRMFIAAICCVLALLSKESAVVFPLLALICFYSVSDYRLSLRLSMRTWPLWFIVTIFLFLRLVILPFHSQDLMAPHPELQAYNSDIFLRIYTCLATLPSYAELLVWPHGLHIERDFPVAHSFWETGVFIGFLLIAAAVCLAVCEQRRTRHGALAFAFLWFAAAYIPQMGILIPVNALFLEHWMYLPSAGLLLGIAQSLATRLPNRKREQILMVATACFALLFGWLTFEQNKIWHDPVALYRHIIAQGETSVRAFNNLGIAYVDKGDYAEAMKQFQLALKIRETAASHQNIASLYSKMPDGGPKMVPQEIEELQRALGVDPDYYRACEALAFLYHYSGEEEKAAIYRARAEAIRQKYRRYE